MNQHIKSFNELFGFSQKEKKEKAFNLLTRQAESEINDFDFNTIFTIGVPNATDVQTMLDTAAILLPSVSKLYPQLFKMHYGRTPQQMRDLGFTDNPLYTRQYTTPQPQDPITGITPIVQNPSSETGALANVDFRGQRGFIPTTFNFLVTGLRLSPEQSWLANRFKQELQKHLKFNRDSVINSLTL